MADCLQCQGCKHIIATQSPIPHESYNASEWQIAYSAKGANTLLQHNHPSQSHTMRPEWQIAYSAKGANTLLQHNHPSQSHTMRMNDRLPIVPMGLTHYCNTITHP